MIYSDVNEWHRIIDPVAYVDSGRDLLEYRVATAQSPDFRVLTQDHYWRTHRRMCAEHGIASVLYQFPYQTAGTPEQQAEYFCGLVEPLRDNEMVMIDIEGRGKLANPVNFLRRWLAVVEPRLNTRAWVYVPRSFASKLTREVTGDRIVKAPDYDANDGEPHSPPTWPHDVWQFSSKAELPGGNVPTGDANITDWTTQQLIDRCKGKSVGEAWKPPEVEHWIGNSNARTVQVDLVALHESVGITDALDLAIFCGSHGVSYHAAADNDKIVYMVPYDRTAWHLRNGNPRSDGLCLTTPAKGYTRDEWLGPQRNKVRIAAWWVAERCRSRGLRVEHCTYAEIRAALAGDVGSGGVITHDDYTQATHDGSHTDPRNFPMDVCIQWAREQDPATSTEGVIEMAFTFEYDDTPDADGFGTFRGWGCCEGTDGEYAGYSGLRVTAIDGEIKDVGVFYVGAGDKSVAAHDMPINSPEFHRVPDGARDAYIAGRHQVTGTPNGLPSRVSAAWLSKAK